MDTCHLAAAAALRSTAHHGRISRQPAADLQAALSEQSDLIFSLLAALSAVLRPFQQLEALVSFEALRVDTNPLFPTLQTNLDKISTALAANGIVQSAPTVGELYDEERHERAARGGVVPVDELTDDLVVKEVVRAGYIHGTTGAVLVPALVHAANNTQPASLGAAASSVPPPLLTPRGTRVHEVRATDTLQGVALRYGVQPAALMRFNRLPSAHAIHARKQLRLPPASQPHAGEAQGEPLWGAPAPSHAGAVLILGGVTLAAEPASPGRLASQPASPAGGDASSMAARIAQRRHASSERRRSGGTGEGDDSGGPATAAATSGGSDDAAGIPPQADTTLVAQLERSLVAAKAAQRRQRDAAQGQRTQSDTPSTTSASPSKGGDAEQIVFGVGSQRHGPDESGGCASWLEESALTHAVMESAAAALMRPWKSVGSAIDPADEMIFLRALGQHASEATVLALLEAARGGDGDGDGDGDVLAHVASAVWRGALSLRVGGDADLPPSGGADAVAEGVGMFAQFGKATSVVPVTGGVGGVYLSNAFG